MRGGYGGSGEAQKTSRYEMDARRARVRLEEERVYCWERGNNLKLGRHLDADSARGLPPSCKRDCGSDSGNQQHAGNESHSSPGRPRRARLCGSAHALEWYFRTPASKLAADIDWLHQIVMWLIIVIFVGVFGVMFYACYAHRKSKGHKAEQFHENTTVEIIWTVIPAIILVVIAWPATQDGDRAEGHLRRRTSPSR